MNYKIEKDKLTVHEKELIFDYEIKSVLEKDGTLMILLKVPAKFNYQRNIFGVSAEGEILWQVEAPTKDPVDLYTQITEENEKVMGGSWSGWNCHLDPKTGKIVGRDFEK